MYIAITRAGRAIKHGGDQKIPVLLQYSDIHDGIVVLKLCAESMENK
jgi:hypothetical protein